MHRSRLTTSSRVQHTCAPHMRTWQASRIKQLCASAALIRGNEVCERRGLGGGNDGFTKSFQLGAGREGVGLRLLKQGRHATLSFKRTTLSQDVTVTPWPGGAGPLGYISCSTKCLIVYTKSNREARSPQHRHRFPA